MKYIVTPPKNNHKLQLCHLSHSTPNNRVAITIRQTTKRNKIDSWNSRWGLEQSPTEMLEPWCRQL